jgi:hypothetical protein
MPTVFISYLEDILYEMIVNYVRVVATIVPHLLNWRSQTMPVESHHKNDDSV